MNDKPWGPHATPASYLMVVLIAAGFASLARVAARRWSRPADPVLRNLLFGAGAVLGVMLSFCLWNELAFNYNPPEP